MPWVILLRYTIGVLPINDDTSPAMASLGAASGAATALTRMAARRTDARGVGISRGWLPLCGMACCWLQLGAYSVLTRTVCDVDPKRALGMVGTVPDAANTVAIEMRAVGMSVGALGEGGQTPTEDLTIVM